MLRALLAAAPPASELERAALAVHSTMLEHGFVCVGVAEPVAPAPVVEASSDGAASLQILPAGWKAAPDVYCFAYVHPLRGSEESFTLKALAVGPNLEVVAASSSAGAQLERVAIPVPREAPADQEGAMARAKDWQEKVAESVALKLLNRHNSTKRLGQAAVQEPGPVARPEAGGERPSAPQAPGAPPVPLSGPPPPRRPDPVDPFAGPPIWTPDYGGLIGPRHPAWRQFVPGRGPGGGMGIFPSMGPDDLGGGDMLPGGLGRPGGLGGVPGGYHPDIHPHPDLAGPQWG